MNERAHRAPENKMGVMPENKLLLSMAVPIMISMLVQAFYNVVDSIFVGQLSENALNAVSLAFPIQNLMISVAVGTGVGINALLSKSLGEKKQDMVNKTAMNGLFLTLLSYLLFAAIGLTCSGLFFRAQTDIPEILNYGQDYMFLCCTLSFGLFFSITFERTLQSTGRTFYTMLSQATGAIINIILDPILIFGYFGLPRLEVAGAAWATVIGQIIGGLLNLYCNLRHNPDIQFRLKGFRPSLPIVRNIYSVGVPSIIMSSIGSVMVFGMNKILIAFTPTATAVFGVYFKLQSFIFMPVFGLNNGMVPIVAYNYGARKPDRILKTIRLSLCYAVSLMAVGFLIFQVFPAQLLSMFESEEATGDMIRIGVPALRTISISFLFAGFCIVPSGVFQALGRGVYSMLVSFARQLVVLLPAAFILSRIHGLDTVWWAFPLADIGAVALSFYFLRQVYRQEIKPQWDGDGGTSSKA